MKMLKRVFTGFIFLTSAYYPSATLSMAESDSLEQGFLNPPRSAKPQTWFHAMSGNMSKVGITKDLEAISRVGLKGAMLFNVAQGVPYGNVKFNSDKHLEMIGHMASESKRLGLEFGIHNCDGWTSSAGPWITPELSMKKVVWSEKMTKGGNVKLQMPQAEAIKGYYQDIALLAYPSLPTEIVDAERRPKITASDPKFDSTGATDGSVVDMTPIQSKPGEETWLQFSYNEPFTLRAAEIFLHLVNGAEFTLLTSDDGVNFKERKKFPSTHLGKRKHVVDANFDDITAKHFRFVTNKQIRVREARLKSTELIPGFASKTSHGSKKIGSFLPFGQPKKDFIINAERIIDLSAKMNSQGVLEANLPEGDWTLMRFGYTTTGATNHPASEEGRGLEVDKFSREAFKVHYNEFVKRVLNKVNKVAPGVFKYVEIDSYEVGGQNWTQGYADKFKKRFNYDLVPYLPLYAGRYVSSAEQSQVVLHHLRELNNHLMVNNYFKYFDELANADGIKTYTEPYGNGPFNELDAGAHADIPMGDFWLKSHKQHIAPIVSIAHINNKNIASAEGFTAKKHINWSFHPGMAKIDGDLVLAQGVNELVFHRFAHQANTHVMPGMVMGFWGANFDRTQTWWDIAVESWVDNITRSQHLLRQGLPATDMLMFVGDGYPTVCPDRFRLKTKLPNYLNYDCVSPEILNTRFKAKNGRLVLPEGTSYKLLYLTKTKEMTMATLNKVNALSRSGIIVVGKRPQNLLASNFKEQSSDRAAQKFKQLVDSIWSRETTYEKETWDKIFKDNKLNFGFRVAGHDHFYYAKRSTKDADIYFLVNNSDKPEVYAAHFDVTGKIPEIWNPVTREIKKIGQFSEQNGKTVVPLNILPEEAMFVVFRESSKGVDHASFDARIPASGKVFLNDNNKVVIETEHQKQYSLTLGNSKRVDGKAVNIPKAKAIDGKWKVRFNPYYGFGETLHFDKLVDWKDHSNSEVRHYSGTATYSNTFEIDKSRLEANKRVLLDLGKVSVAAEVVINSEFAGVAWVKPHVIDITEHVKLGKNTITVEVANSWTNRLISDKEYPDTTAFTPAGYFPHPDSRMPEWYTNNEPAPPGKRRTFATFQFYKAGDPLASSGLIGPVLIKSRATHLVSTNK